MASTLLRSWRHLPSVRRRAPQRWRSSAARLALAAAVAACSSSGVRPPSGAWPAAFAPPVVPPASARRATSGAEAGAGRPIPVDTIVFDIDDTLYPASSGFSDHRMGEVTRDFMVERLGFDTPKEALDFWGEYIRRYHSTMKALTVATEEGRLPRPFVKEELAQWWAERCDYTRFMQRDPDLVDMMASLAAANLTLVAFTNAPRAYALRCLEVLGVRPFFPDARIFAVEDVLPACKPERSAFERVLSSVGAVPERAVMFEDSMKNVRACHSLGMQTVLITEESGASTGEANLLGDIVDLDDPAVGAVLPRAAAARQLLPGLWRGVFQSPPRA